MPKPRRCPECGSTRIVPIAYGMPGPETVEEERRGDVIIGGCMIGPDSPGWGCGACGWAPWPSPDMAPLPGP